MSNLRNWMVHGSSPLLTGLISYWKLDDVSGNAIDSHTGGNNGTVTGATQGSTGKLGTSYTFGSGKYVSCGNPTNLSFTTAGTISAWIYPTALTGDKCIVSKEDYDGDLTGYNLFLHEASIGVELANATPDAYQFVDGTGTITIQQNQWQFVVLTWNSTTVKIYYNGTTAVKSASQTIVPISNVIDFQIGGNAVLTTCNFIGKIDEVGVWNRALTQNEVLFLYNSGNGFAYPF